MTDAPAPVHGDAVGRGDRIRVTGIRARGHHGVFDHEKRDGQEFVVDVTVHTDLSRASTTDDLGDTVHYGELAELAAAEISGDAADLIETVAERIASGVLARWRVPLVEVTVHKPHAPITVPFDDVTVTIVRGPAARAGHAPTSQTGPASPPEAEHP